MVYCSECGFYNDGDSCSVCDGEGELQMEEYKSKIEKKEKEPTVEGTCALGILTVLINIILFQMLYLEVSILASSVSLVLLMGLYAMFLERNIIYIVKHPKLDGWKPKTYFWRLYVIVMFMSLGFLSTVLTVHFGYYRIKKVSVVNEKENTEHTLAT